MNKVSLAIIIFMHTKGLYLGLVHDDWIYLSSLMAMILIYKLWKWLWKKYVGW